MKKMLLNKKNLYIKLTAVLILMIVGILGIYTAFVQKIATGQCFNILDDSRERMGQMIVNEMQNEQDHLEAASYLLKNLLTDYDANEEMVLQIMRASSADKSYAHWKSVFFCGTDSGRIYDHRAKNSTERWENTDCHAFQLYFPGGTVCGDPFLGH